MRRRTGVLLLMVVLLSGCGALDPRYHNYRMPSEAMQPAVKAGQTVRARVVEHGRYRPHRGDIVVFDAPPSWGTGVFLKRVIGLPGEHVACCDPGGHVLVDGAPLAEPYVAEDAPLDGPPGNCVGRRFGPVEVPPAAIFVAGDRRGMSGDSRCSGPVPADRVIGVVVG